MSKAKSPPSADPASFSREGRPVLVCDTHYDVFFGYTTEDGRGETICLTAARNCFSYTAGPGDDKGTYSLATLGPQPGSKISAAVSRMIVRDVANVTDVLPAAVTAWEVSKWKI